MQNPYRFQIYRDGSLPFPAQHFRTPVVQVLRAEYWMVDLWHHANLSAPYWRLYWNQDRGAWISLFHRHWSLDPHSLILIPPRTPFRTGLHSAHGKQIEEGVMRGSPYQTPATGRRTGKPRGSIRQFFVHFTAGFPCDSGSPRVFSFPVDSRLNGLLETMTAHLKINQAQFDHQQTFGLLALIHHALEKVPEDYWPHPPDDPRIIRVMQHMDINYRHAMRNTDFARMAGMNPNAFARLFKEKTHLTPLEYLRSKRLEKAAILLIQTDRSIEDIAASCGFFDRNHFSRIFQRHSGMGPATYRRSRRH